MKLDVMKFMDEATRRRFRPIRPTKGFLNPSGASIETVNAEGDLEVRGQCMRRRWYKYHGYPEPPEDLESLLRMTCGEWIAAGVTEVFKRLGLYEGEEIDVIDDEIGFSGRIDLLLRDPKFTTEDIVELKTLFTYYSTKMCMEEAKLEHVLQTVLYLFFTRKAGRDVTDAHLFYIAPSTGQVKIDSVNLAGDENGIYLNGKLQDYTIQDILDREVYWKEVKDLGAPPRREFELQYSKDKLKYLADSGKLSKTDTTKFKKSGTLDKGDFQCRYCPFAEECWKDE